MTQNEFLLLAQQPHSVGSHHVLDLKELVERYPYFAQARLLHTKALMVSKSIYFESNQKISSVYSPNRSWYYYYLHPENKISEEPYKRESISNHGGGYFDILNTVESGGGDAKQSLRNLAEKLKSARNLVSDLPEKHVVKEHVAPNSDTAVSNIDVNVSPVEIGKTLEAESKMSTDYFEVVTEEVSIENVKKLIYDKNYVRAIEILKELNLNNPKKSVYFADQIRFLEKVVSNQKK